MVDLQRVFVDDDALDDELQDSLALAEVGLLEPRADPPAERGHVRQHRLDANALVGQAAVLVALLRGGLLLLGDRPAPLGQLLEADHLGLVGLEQPPVGPRQAVEPGLQLPPDRLLLGAPVRRLGGEPLELGDQLPRVAEQADRGPTPPARSPRRRSSPAGTWCRARSSARRRRRSGSRDARRRRPSGRGRSRGWRARRCRTSAGSAGGSRASCCCGTTPGRCAPAGPGRGPTSPGPPAVAPMR